MESVFRAGDGSEKAFTEEQIIDFLKQAKVGVPVKELCHRHGFSYALFYTWRAKFGCTTAPEAKRLKDLVRENSRLKTLLAEAHLDIEALKVESPGKRVSPIATGGSAGDAGANRYLRVSYLSVDRAVLLCTLPAKN